MTQPIVTEQIKDFKVNENSRNRTFNLEERFDDPSTTGKIARFEFADDIGGGVTDVLLFDQEGVGALATVENFLSYVEDEQYDHSVIHRSIPGFIIQGGGFGVDDSELVQLTAEEPIVNEFSPERSNLQGTIAVAKLEGDPNSGTNQWFFNLEDNSANLDEQNEGFTVFGQILNQEDFEPIKAIGDLSTVNGGGAFSNVPLTDVAEPIDTDDLVFLNKVTVGSEAELEFSVVDNSNSRLVDASITDGELILDFAPNRSGEATLTIEATNLLGESIQEEFAITVESSDF